MEVQFDESIFEVACETVAITHRASGLLEDVEKTPDQLLSPATNLMDWPVVFEDLFDFAAITQPKEFGPP